MAPPGRRGVGAARGPREMGALGGEAAAAEAGPASCFPCPEDFCARRFAPGAAFCPEPPGKRLLLISAPADFRPESLSGHRLALPGSPLVRATQPDGSQKTYSLQASREESAARLLIAAARPERLTCAQPFTASLRIQEKHGDPGAPGALFPVAERPPPQVPEGLKQRFFPFGARLKGPIPSSEGAEKAARKRGKKRPLLPLEQALWQQEGPQRPLGGFPEPVGGLLGGGPRAGSQQRPLKEEEGTQPAMLPVLGGRLLWQDARPSGPLEEGSSLGEVEEPDRRRARKREKKRKSGLQTEELQDPSSRYWQPELEPCLQGEREPEGGGGDCAGEPAGCKAKKKKKKKTTQEAVAEGLCGAAAIKEEPVEVPCLGSLLEENLRAIGEDPVGEVFSCKKKKKKKKRSRERLAEGLWGAAAIKEELGDVPCLESLPEGGLGSAREEPGRGFASHIKQSPGKGEGGLWGVVALKEELEDLPSLGSLAEESLGVSGELASCKKKKKSRERAVEVLGGVSAIKEELGHIGCSGSLLEEGLGSATGGPAGELLACKKKKKKGGKVDKEPLQERGTNTAGLGCHSLVRGRARGGAPRGGRGKDQAGDSAAGTALLLPTVAHQLPCFYSPAACPSE